MSNQAPLDKQSALADLTSPELREAIEFQAATDEVLRIISRSTRHLQPVLDTIIASATRLCAATRGHIYMFDGELLKLGAAHGAWPGFTEYLQQNPLRPGGGSVAGHAAELRRTVQVADVLDLPDYQRGELVKQQGFRTVLSVPMLREGELLGVINILKTLVEPFSDRQVALVETFADQAVIAIQNVRLFAEVEKRNSELLESLEQQTATADVLRIISRSRTELQPVLDAISDTAAKLCRADGAFMWRLRGDTFYLAAMNKIDTDFARFARDNPLPLDKGTSAGRCVLEGRTIHIPDALADPDYRWHGDKGQKIGQFRALLGVPLMRDEVKFGAFALFRREPEPFTDKEIELVTTFADQAVIAIENARLLEAVEARSRELRESLEYQTATSEVLKVISNAANDLQIVFDAMLRDATRLCEAKVGVLFRFADGAYTAVAKIGVTAAYAKWLDSGPIRPGSGSGLARLMETRQTIQVADTLAENVYAEREEVRVATAELGGIRSLLNVPMLKDDELIGAIGIYRQEVQPFTAKQVELVTTFADQAVIAIENTRLFNELEESLEYQTAVGDVLGVISRSPNDVRPVYEAIVENAGRLCEAEFSTVASLAGEELHLTAVDNMSPEELEAYSRIFPRPVTRRFVMGRAILDRKTVHVDDVNADDDYDPRTLDILQKAGQYRTIMGVPILRKGEPVGVIGLVRREVRPFTLRQIALVETFAEQAVIAVENARLFSEIQESLEFQTAASDMLGVISRSPSDTQPVFDAIVERAQRLCDAEFSHVSRFHDGKLHIEAVSNLRPEETAVYKSIFPREPTRGYVVGRAFLDGVPVHVTDIAADPDYDQAILQTLKSTSAYRTYLGIPILRHGTPIGVIGLGRREVKPFTERQIKLLQTFADQAVIAVENARAFAEIQEKTRQVQQQSAELAEWNHTLESRVKEQVDQLGRMSKLTRFLSPKITSLIMSGEADDPLKTRRAEITVVYVDLRGFTAFTETTDPEEVMAVLREYHAELGKASTAHDGTIEHFAGDGAMILFNAPMAMEDHEMQAIRMTLQIRESVGALTQGWRKRGFNLGFGAGIAGGYATMGTIGFAERLDYSAIGIVCNLSARLCSEATDGQILISPRVFVKVEDRVDAESMGELNLKGFHRPVAVYNLLGFKHSEAA
ncbi:MAG: GAF domain-containing protein [Pseudomonadota bacterium]|nr:GAF domain-containing protein [Pseudomonadota bacterium]